MPGAWEGGGRKSQAARCAFSVCIYIWILLSFLCEPMCYRGLTQEFLMKRWGPVWSPCAPCKGPCLAHGCAHTS